MAGARRASAAADESPQEGQPAVFASPTQPFARLAGELPKICRQHTITVGTGDLGHLDKLRQDLPYLSPTRVETYKSARAMSWT
ncbi:hypothetical protein ACFWY5_38960 [Nonomuraea sp. NPDC059007]|uniref:hypothetical protein n=1 Tax=Nonomuraea sp. NPDC059007 TaxID=3346692 RepID=UPI003686D7D5